MYLALFQNVPFLKPFERGGFLLPSLFSLSLFFFFGGGGSSIGCKAKK